MMIILIILSVKKSLTNFNNSRFKSAKPNMLSKHTGDMKLSSLKL